KPWFRKLLPLGSVEAETGDARGRDGGIREELAAGVSSRSGSPLAGAIRTLSRHSRMTASDPKCTSLGVRMLGQSIVRVRADTVVPFPGLIRGIDVDHHK